MTKKTRLNYDSDSRSSRSHSSRSSSSKRRDSGGHENVVPINHQTEYIVKRVDTPLSAKNKSQEIYIKAIKNNHLTFGIGPAGTGKSYCAGAIAADYLSKGLIDRIFLTRPAVEAGENLGFLPGDLDEKFSVYIEPFIDVLNERLGSSTVQYCMKHGRIVAAPLAYMRGKTFGQKTFVLLDEAQNTSPTQMKMFLTRIGEGSKVVINGDVAQSDIKGLNGLADAVQKLADLDSVFIHQFEKNDIVRSGLVAQIVEKYEI